MRIHTFAICAYKESEYLEECIESLMNQTVKSEIIMATHTPSDFLTDICKTYDIPLYINEGEAGITQDWNFALSKAKTRFVTIAHQDDKYEPDYTRQVVGRMRRAKKPLIGFTDYYEIRRGERVEKSTMIRIKKWLTMPLRLGFVRKSRILRRYTLSLGDPIICPSVTFAVRNLPKPIFEDHFICCEDWEMLEKVFGMKGDIIYVPKKLTYHRIHEESTTSIALSGGIRKKENFEMFRKFWPKPIAAIINKVYNQSEKFNKVDNV
ncbi:MAG: glycosyltransferase [Eubacterium sp.]|nr:glycosyltransferase [Eubacterium sp.]